MVLRNFYLAFKSFFKTADSLYTVNVKGGYPLINDPANMWGIGRDGDGMYPSMYKVRTSYASSYGGVIFGDGDTPVKYADNKLSGNVISTITASANITKENSEDAIGVTGLYTITNTGSESITIKEVGLLVNSRGTASEENAVLIERTILDEPVTIPAGGVGQVTYTVHVVCPSA